jgi:hypothetical protein
MKTAVLVLLIGLIHGVAICYDDIVISDAIAGFIAPALSGLGGEWHSMAAGPRPFTAMWSARRCWPWSSAYPPDPIQTGVSGGVRDRMRAEDADRR